MPNESGGGSTGDKSVSQRSSLGIASIDPERNLTNKVGISDKRLRDGLSFSMASKSFEKPFRMPKGPEKVGRNGAGFVMKGKPETKN